MLRWERAAEAGGSSVAVSAGASSSRSAGRSASVADTSALLRPNRRLRGAFSSGAGGGVLDGLPPASTPGRASGSSVMSRSIDPDPPPDDPIDTPGAGEADVRAREMHTRRGSVNPLHPV
ncbi:hypothetical protein GCM10011519_27500 [Marmoricola endophyticus]|uniref:Uncharacterized protein n=1 Tax=Marmoricola endophyticus TaxID=2040280 RepID=A0A917F6U5_9ACTN|nr:hypothetical protein GCM10011519_27500 [Marmoricola endophyticus]